MYYLINLDHSCMSSAIDEFGDVMLWNVSEDGDNDTDW